MFLDEGVYPIPKGLVEDIAAYYDRTVAGIHHRVQLMGLIDGIKEMFREGKMTLSGAALVASLPPEDQTNFHKKFGKKGADKWAIQNFLNTSQRFTLDYVADRECEECRKRTHNSAPGLFDDEYFSIHDVCFDGECYAKKWRNLILHHIVESGNEANTEHKIILSRGVPRFVSMKNAALDLEGEEYVLLAPDKHTWSETNKKSKANTAWLVSEGTGHKPEIKRVSYKQCERPIYGSYNSAPADPIKEYMIDQIPDIQEDDRKAAAEKVEKKYPRSWQLKRRIKEMDFTPTGRES